MFLLYRLKTYRWRLRGTKIMHSFLEYVMVVELYTRPIESSMYSDTAVVVRVAAPKLWNTFFRSVSVPLLPSAEPIIRRRMVLRVRMTVEPFRRRRMVLLHVTGIRIDAFVSTVTWWRHPARKIRNDVLLHPVPTRRKKVLRVARARNGSIQRNLVSRRLLVSNLCINIRNGAALAMVG
jgi:hypothetical protein